MQFPILKVAILICGFLALIAIIFALGLSYIPAEAQINLERNDTQFSSSVNDQFIFSWQCTDVDWQSQSLKAIFVNNNPSVGESSLQHCPNAASSDRIYWTLVYPDDTREIVNIPITVIDKTFWFWGATLILCVSLIVLRAAHPRLTRYLLYAASVVLGIVTLFVWLYPMPARFNQQVNDANLELQVDRSLLLSRWSCTNISWNIQNISEIYYFEEPTIGVNTVRYCPQATESDAALLTVVYQDGTEDVFRKPIQILTNLPPFRLASAAVVLLIVIQVISVRQWHNIYQRMSRFIHVDIPQHYRRSAAMPLEPLAPASASGFLLNTSMLLIIDGIWLIFFTVLFWSNWHELLTNNVIQAGFAVLWFLTPGIFITRNLKLRQALGTAEAAADGFAVSCLLGAGLYFYAANMNQTPATVMLIFWLTGPGAGLLLVFRRLRQSPRPPIHVKFYPQQTFLILMAILVVFLHSRVALADHIYVSDADYTIYNAFVTHFAESEALMDREVVYGTQNRPYHRFLLAYWPANQAIMVQVADANVLRLFTFIAPYMIVVVMLSVYALAKAVGFSTEMALFAVIAHSALLLSMPLGWMFPGDVFSTRLMQDKGIAAFILAPILFRNVIQYYKQRHGTQLFFVIVTTLSLMFTHPTIMVFVAIIIGLLSVLNTITDGDIIRSGIVIGVLALAMVPPLFQRVFDKHLNQATEPVATYTVSFTENPNQADLRVIDLIVGTRFYGFNEHRVNSLAFGIFVMASVVAVGWGIYPKASKLLAAAFALFLLGYIPYTGWIIGLIVTPNQLVRIPWLMPIGIGAAYLVFAIWQLGINKFIKSITMWLSLCAAAVAFIGIYDLPERQERIEEITDFYQEQDVVYGLDAFITFERVGQQFAELGAESKVVLAEDPLSTWLPAISGNTYTVSYMMNNRYWQGGLTQGEGASLTRKYERLISEQTSIPRWNQLMQELGVDYIVVKQGDDFHRRLQTELASYVDEVFIEMPFIAYRYQP